MKKSVIFILLFPFFIQAQSISQNLNLLFNWQNINLVGSSAFNNTYNEIWGVVVNGKEYAVIGSTAGTHIFDVSDPVNSNEVVFIPGESAGANIIHRDYHDYQNYLYIVADEGWSSKLKVVDLSFLPDSVSVVYNSNSYFTTAHNIFIDTATAKLYVCGSDYSNMDVLDLTEPENPSFMFEYSDVGYVHDVYVKNDTAYLNAGNNGLFIVDFSIANPQVLASLTSYSYQGYNHSGWLSEDGETYFFADENHGYLMKSIDVSDFSNVTEIDTFNSGVNTQSMAHNLIVKDDYLYVSHYHDGLQIFDISNPSDVNVVAYYKTYELNDYISYRGAWGVYPLLPSGNILVSDMQYGLFVLQGSNLSFDEDIQNDSHQIKSYPNPFKDILNINFYNTESKEITLLDITGSRVFTLNSSILTHSFDTSNFPPGIYFLSVKSGNNTELTKLIKY